MTKIEEYLILDTFIRKRILLGFNKLNKKYIKESFDRYCKSYCDKTGIEYDNIPDIISRISDILGNKIEFYESNHNTIGKLDVSKLIKK